MLRDGFEVPTPIGEAAVFRDMLAHVSRVAPINRPVLVVGERGTGKELVASRLAFLSPRWDRPFVKVNCGALPDGLLDSELFGHEMGAFTGARQRRAGRFERADGGTLFLDEIANASLAVQERLLRAIEYGAYDRVGGGEQRVDVRVIAATNADLPALATEGRFRADLLDRLAFDVIVVPPLRARREDIPLLAETFAARMASELRRDYFPGYTRAAMTRLVAYDWPGNVRELRNAVERSVCRMEEPERPLDAIVLDPFRPSYASPPLAKPALAEAPQGYAASMRAHERALLQEALQRAQYSQARAARLLGLTYDQFRHHLRRHGLLPGRRGEAAAGGCPAP